MRPVVPSLVCALLVVGALAGCGPPDSDAPTGAPTGDRASAAPTGGARSGKAATPRLSTPDRVLTGQHLTSGESIATETGAQRLTMQPDGDVVLVEGTTAIWNTGTAGNPGASLRLGTDGRLAVNSPGGDELWSNGVRSEGARLVVKPDGHVYEISAAGESLWSSRSPSYLAAAGPYVNPSSPAALGAARATSEGRASDAALLTKAAGQGSARWLTPTEPVATVEATVRAYAAAADVAGQTPVFVAYAIPDRDCGSHSAGGFSPADYRSWSAAVARGLAGTRAVIIVEPDSLLQIYSCGSSDVRFALLRQVSAGYAAAGAEVYLDAGSSNSFAQSPKRLADIAARLKTAGVEHVAGFATNVANFQTTADETAYGKKLSELLGGANFIIDTSRNGNGGLRDASGGVWCNPAGRALGDPPGATSDGPHVANLWVKTVGASDGTCNGGPPAGRYWEKYLLELASNARW